MRASSPGGPPEGRKQSEIVELVPKQEVDRAQQQIEWQQREIERVRKQLETAWRAAKRQAAPFCRGEPKTDPKPPGRKGGER